MENTNEITNTEEVFNLVELLLKEQYSKDISDIGRDLLYNEISTIPEIQARTKLSFEAIKNALIVLMQNKLASCKGVVKKETEMTGYEIMIDNVLSILQYPKILSMINGKFGEYGTMIFEEFMHLGILSAGQIFEQVKSRIEKGKKINMTMINKIKVTFVNLIEGNYVIQAAKVKGRQLKQKDNLKDRKKKEKKKEKENKKDGRNKKNADFNTSSNNKKENKKNSKDINKRIKELDEEITEKLDVTMSGKKKKKNNQITTTITNEKNEETTIVANNNLSQNEEESSLIFNKETGKYYYFYFNYDQIISEIKTQFIIDFLTQKISSQAGLICNLLLEKNQITSYQTGLTYAVSYTEITTRLNSITESQIHDIVKESNDFFTKITSDTISLNLIMIGNALKDITIEKMIEQQFSLSHVRIYRLLSLCGALDSRNIMDICLFPPKTCNSLMNQLFSEGLVETQTMTVKSSNILFYSINRNNAIERLISNCYKIIKNMKLALIHELDRVKNTTSHQAQEQYISKISIVINEVNDTIILLKSL